MPGDGRPCYNCASINRVAKPAVGLRVQQVQIKGGD
jgi:hypothetical protein